MLLIFIRSKNKNKRAQRQSWYISYQLKKIKVSLHAANI